MYLRRRIRKKNGKPHTYWALVEAYRTARGSRQRLVAYVGELKKSEPNGWAQLGRRLEGQARPQPSLFDPPHQEEPTDAEAVEVHLKGVRLERLRDFGEVWLAWGLWRLLGLDTLLAEKMPAGREEISWATVAAILTLARFCAPVQRVAHRGPLVRPHGAGGPLGRPGREGPYGSFVGRFGSAARTPRERGEAPQGAFGGPV